MTKVKKKTENQQGSLGKKFQKNNIKNNVTPQIGIIISPNSKERTIDLDKAQTIIHDVGVIESL